MRKNPYKRHLIKKGKFKFGRKQRKTKHGKSYIRRYS